MHPDSHEPVHEDIVEDLANGSIPGMVVPNLLKAISRQDLYRHLGRRLDTQCNTATNNGGIARPLDVAGVVECDFGDSEAVRLHHVDDIAEIRIWRDFGKVGDRYVVGTTLLSWTRCLLGLDVDWTCPMAAGKHGGRRLAHPSR